MTLYTTPPTTKATGKRSHSERRLAELRSQASNWKNGWEPLKTYIDPARGIFDNDRSDIGNAFDHQTLIDAHGTYSRNTTASGLQTGTSDPSRPWFKVTIDSLIIELVPAVKEWLDEVNKRMIYVLQKSNAYEVLYSTYEEITQFGTGCFIILEDQDDVIRLRSFTVGEYFLGTDSKGRVNTFGRDYQMTICQLVEEFGLDSVSDQVRAKYEEGTQLDELVNVCHLIEPNKNYNADKMDIYSMPFKSCYWEKAANTDTYLAERGYRRLNIIAPRWKTVTTDMTYGYGPGWYAIGDIKQLQAVVTDKLMAEEKLGNPPLQKDANVQGNVHNIPGGVTTVSSNVPNAGVRALYEVDPRLDAFELSIDNLHKRIDRHFFADLFLMINGMDTMGSNPQKTAFEIAERKAEKMMMLGPILHKLTEELHDPLVENQFYIMLENGLFPEPPAELEGQELKIQYISILAQAQRAVGITSIERVLGYVMNASQVYPEAKHYFSVGESIKQVADMEGIPSKIIPEDAEIEAAMEQEAQQQNMMMSNEMANQAADTTKKLSGAKTSEPSALTGLMKGMK